jgi:hypothetical protein
MNIANEFDAMHDELNSLYAEEVKIRQKKNDVKHRLTLGFDPVIQKLHEIGDYAKHDEDRVRFLSFKTFRECTPEIIDIEKPGIYTIDSFKEHTNYIDGEYKGVTFISVALYDEWDYRDNEHYKFDLWLPKSWFESDAWASKYKELFDELMEPIIAQEKLEATEAEERERMQYEKLKAKFEQNFN